ncbi:hypothetical protein O9G_005750 [Rozella allomycis CSF55]|uniref:RRM domain-containing protein n=1 Tax=Rozella allomycis (strain CSF55) TaxID=988480 RepID=A0A075AW13_ROZAC|nr:hypothetical protein O9G_005750 [Rozella allomycis CSF55]|eukprot:EPZ34450.1 hypothetical protein O9G_005750 [Rozella allomycis CSF55]
MILDLQEHLSGYGQLEKAFIIQDRETRRSKGYGFAIFSEQKDADRVIKELDGSVFNGRRMVVRRREPRVVNESAERAEQQSNIEESAVESNESTEEVEATQKEQSSNQ